MDFRFYDEQLALRDAVRSFCGRTSDLAQIAGREGKAVEDSSWAGLAELGVLGLLADTGEFGLEAAAIVFEELGAHLISGPVVWSTLCAGFVGGVDTGDIKVTGTEITDGWDGPMTVDHAEECEVIVTVRSDRVELIHGVDLPEPLTSRPLDPLTPTAVFASLPNGSVVGGADLAAQIRLQGTILTSAALVGAAQGALDVAAEYALSRQQFGVAIGSFQAVKHLLADMYVRVALARSATYAAAAGAQEPGPDARAAASGAKLLAGEAAIDNGRTAVQVLGGMGFTWDMLPHYFLKRAWVWENAFGTGTHHSQQIAAALEADVRGQDAPA
jgi:alkylation response protein AidB-like acyl-CoA dehydrogenase